MADLKLLENVIKNAALNPISEKPAEEYFDQIVSCIEQEKTNEAGTLIEKVLAKNVPDVRLIVYYFYVHFAENGIKSFGATFPIITTLVNDHWETLTPKNRIDKHVENSLNWFFSHILLRIKHYEKLHKSGKVHPVWKKSVLEISSEDVNLLIAAAQEFKTFFLGKWPKSPSKDRVLHLVSKIEEIERIVAQGEKKSADLNEEIEEQIEETASDEEISPNSETESVEEAEPSRAFVSDFFEDEDVFLNRQSQWDHAGEMEEPKGANLAEPSDSTLEAKSEPLSLFIASLDELSRKLKVFEDLIGKNDYLKAAVVANDIERMIENFDPLNYFPKLFSRYFSLFAKHVAALTDEFEKKETLQVKALEKLYRTDLQLFLEW